MNLKEELNKRLDKIMLMTEATARKIIKKELKNFKRDVIKNMLKRK